MSRIVNLQTIRFQIFNVLDTWHTNWADDYNYSHLLYEDLGIRSYFIGVFYRLRMPTNYIYIHRLANGSSLLLNTDIYFYKPLKRTKLHRYFIEQRHYYNYLLKLYVYLTPYLIRSMTKQIRYRKYRRRYLNSLSFIRVRRFMRKGYLPFKSRRVAASRFRAIKDIRFLRHSIRAGGISNGLLLTGFRSLQFRKKRLRRTQVARIYTNVTSSFVRLFSVLFYNSFLSNYVYLFKDLTRSIGISTFVSTASLRMLAYKNSRTVSSLFKSNALYVRRFKYRKLKLSYSNRSVYFSTNSIVLLYSILSFGLNLLRRIRSAKHLGVRKIRFLSKQLRRCFRYMAFTFYGWLLSKLKVVLMFLLYKIISVSTFLFHTIYSHAPVSVYLLSYFMRFSNLVQIRTRFAKSVVTTITSSFLNINSGKLNAVYFLNIIRNIHRRFYQKRKARAIVRAIPRAFNYGYLTRNYVTLLFSYLCSHIERVLSSYTKQQVYFLYNLFYLGNKYYPAILNAKVLCDYFVYLIHTKKSMRGAFFKIRQWQIDNIKRRLSLESMYFKTQMRGKPLSYIDHLSYKKYPIIGIRIECSGNKKKGTMSKKTFYGDLIRDRLIFPKSPNNTFSADMDYYQSFAITKSCSIGVKVWVFFKTHVYDSHGAIRSLIVY